MRSRRQLKSLLVLIVLVTSANSWPNARQDHDDAGDSERIDGNNETTIDDDEDPYPDGHRVNVNDTDDADTEPPILSKVSSENVFPCI